jgi:hypothetical protein
VRDVDLSAAHRRESSLVVSDHADLDPLDTLQLGAQ